jgi:DNA-binding CsgD family transcriptional regulator
LASRDQCGFHESDSGNAGCHQGHAVLYVDARFPSFDTKIILGQLVRTNAPGPSSDDLTPRELEIVKLLAQGKSNKEVANALQISVKTVDAHRTNIMRKLNLNTYSGFIFFAIRHKIVEV